MHVRRASYATATRSELAPKWQSNETYKNFCLAFFFCLSLKQFPPCIKVFYQLIEKKTMNLTHLKFASTRLISTRDTVNAFKRVGERLWPHQPSFGAPGPYIIDTLLLFQCFEKNDHHGSATLFSVGPSGFRRKPAAAIFTRGASACCASG